MNAKFPIDAPDLVALIGSRICHDLASPLGAVKNGAELLDLSSQGGSGGLGIAERDLISESVALAEAKLKFLRIAYGVAGREAMVGRGDVLGILTELYAQSRLKVHWAVDTACPRTEVKLAFLMLQCLESAMPYGGHAHISRDGELWSLRGESDKLKADPAHWKPLARGAIPTPLAASRVQFGLVHLAAAEVGRTLKVTHGPRSVTLEA